MITTSKLAILINGEKPVCLSYELDDVFSFQPEREVKLKTKLNRLFGQI